VGPEDKYTKAGAKVVKSNNANHVPFVSGVREKADFHPNAEFCPVNAKSR
jgi:hypothetical protein